MAQRFKVARNRSYVDGQNIWGDEVYNEFKNWENVIKKTPPRAPFNFTFWYQDDLTDISNPQYTARGYDSNILYCPEGKVIKINKIIAHMQGTPAIPSAATFGLFINRIPELNEDSELDKKPEVFLRLVYDSAIAATVNPYPNLGTLSSVTEIEVDVPVSMPIIPFVIEGGQYAFFNVQGTGDTWNKVQFTFYGTIEGAEKLTLPVPATDFEPGDVITHTDHNDMFDAIADYISALTYKHVHGTHFVGEPDAGQNTLIFYVPEFPETVVLTKIHTVFTKIGTTHTLSIKLQKNDSTVSDTWSDVAGADFDFSTDGTGGAEMEEGVVYSKTINEDTVESDGYRWVVTTSTGDQENVSLFLEFQCNMISPAITATHVHANTDVIEPEEFMENFDDFNDALEAVNIPWVHYSYFSGDPDTASKTPKFSIPDLPEFTVKRGVANLQSAGTINNTIINYQINGTTEDTDTLDSADVDLIRGADNTADLTDETVVKDDVLSIDFAGTGDQEDFTVGFYGATCLVK